ncbi:lysosomal alpha-mannosidase-like [Ixodes scapularis]|uniref:lysosomal alpha-mannosidase-like n=1 Tax=Ixodes scapularis TaxID=6945 RepID=UPI001A9F4D86|nr:lysosomal alpha-mannosidase-like [Ixodes scapularis]
MNDEASTLYTDVVDQMTLGHRWINATFGPCALPRAVWQLDPFGHSKEQAALFGQMEFDGLLLGRVHYLDHDWRRANHKAEFLWRGDDSLKQDIFTAVLPHEYSAPVSLDFTGPFLTKEQLKDFTPLVLNITRSDGFRTNQKIVMFGGDFAFYNATRWYSQMDSLMDIINSEKDSGFYAFYSTPGCFLRSLNTEWTTSLVNSSNEIEPVHRGDFFPYSDKPGDLWTGFYSSRPSLKYLIRRASNFLQVTFKTSVCVGWVLLALCFHLSRL